jgi:hypothetical protein
VQVLVGMNAADDMSICGVFDVHSKPSRSTKPQRPRQTECEDRTVT